MRVVEGEQGIAQQRRQQRARVLHLFGIAGGLLDGGAQIQFALRVEVAIGPIAEAHGVLLIGGERGARQLDFADAAGQFVDQLGVELLSLGHGLDVIGELEQGIQRDDALRFQDAHQVLHHLVVGFGIGGIAGQQVQHLAVRVADGRVGAEQQLHAVAPRIEEFAIAAHRGEAADDAGEHGIGLRVGNALLPHQDLPETDQRLEGAGQVGVQRLVLHLADGRHLIQEQNDGLFRDAARFAEQRDTGCRRCDTRAPGGRPWPR